MGRLIGMRVFLFVLAYLTLVRDGVAFEFKYIETDKFYNTRVRELIESEYYFGKRALELKASTLGMKVRKGDMQKLKKYMREKAFLYGTCFDASILKKSDDANIDAQAYAVGCVKEGLKIADQVDRRAWSEWTGRSSTSGGDSVHVDLCFPSSSMQVPPLFEFLKDEESHPSGVLDYYKLKQCILASIDPGGLRLRR
jgi:hypothetical protein